MTVMEVSKKNRLLGMYEFDHKTRSIFFWAKNERTFKDLSEILEKVSKEYGYTLFDVNEMKE